MITLAYLFTSVGRPKHIRVMAGALEGDIFIGPKAEVGRMINSSVGKAQHQYCRCHRFCNPVEG